MTVRALLAAALAGLLLPSPACSHAAPANVLVITLDTVRADHLGCYGNDARDVTPHLDALARQSVLFEHAFANSSFTPPTHASIFTGLYPSEHGLLNWSRHLADVTTAAQLFAAAGYRTAGFSPMPTLFKLGLDKGFAATTSPPFQMRGEQAILADADAMNDAALPFLTAHAEEPFFAWVHYYDAHRPYAWQGPEWSGRYTDHDDRAVGATDAWYQLTEQKRRALGITPEQVRLLADHYDGGLAYLDDRVGRLLDALAAAGVLDRTVLVVVADHGEVFDEHEPEWFSHDPYLVDENVHVPLLLRLPGAEHAGLHVPDLVQQVDLLPTLLALAGIAPPAHLSGGSLLPLLQGGTSSRHLVVAERQGNDLRPPKVSGDTPPAPAFTADEIRRARDRQLMLRTDTRKLVIYEDQLDAEDRARVGWYAVDGTTPESADLLASEPDAAASAKRAALEWNRSLIKAGNSGPDDTGADDDLLRALGYTGPNKPK